MIIECKNCQKKFIVNDSAIGNNGRVVQCSNCSTQWHQMPISSNISEAKPVTDDNISTRVFEEEIDKDILRKDVLDASDGNTYKFMGKQWALVLPSGKMGKLAKKKIAFELNEKTGRIKKINQKQKIKIASSNETTQIYSEKDKGMGMFNFLVVLIIFSAAVILLLDTFKNQISPFWPELDSYLLYIYETINNIFIIIKDLFNNYK